VQPLQALQSSAALLHLGTVGHTPVCCTGPCTTAVKVPHSCAGLTCACCPHPTMALQVHRLLHIWGALENCGMGLLAGPKHLPSEWCALALV